MWKFVYKLIKFKQRLVKSDNEYFDLQDITGVLLLHHWECVFELNAPKQILERLSTRTKKEWLDGLCKDKNIHLEFKNCFIKSEIFCPHERINRKKEYGIDL